MTDPQVREALVLTTAFALVLGPAAASAHRQARRAPRPNKPMERLQAREAEAAGDVGNPTTALGEAPGRSLRADLFGCLGFGGFVLGLIATALIWDVPPWQR